jgi:AcrR family transcriptional regulator
VDDVKAESSPPPTRAERARLTRRGIVAAAAGLFLERGYGATKLDQVAERAGVAVQTVYFHFGNKATLLKEALDVAAVGDDEPVPLLERPWLDALKAESDPVRAIALWAASGRGILERIAPLMSVVRGSVGADPDLAAQWDANEQQRRTAFRALAEILADRGVLRAGLGVEDAAELAFLIQSVDNYLVATRVLGWSPERWERTTVSLLAAALLDVADAPGR